ncbi:MAG: hypothetical protein ACRBCT_01835 [Alphaproteobacteria bacterium]
MAKVQEVKSNSVDLYIASAKASHNQPEYLDGSLQSCELTGLPKIVTYDFCGTPFDSLKKGDNGMATTQIVYRGGSSILIPGEPEPEPMMEKKCLKSFKLQLTKMTK